MEYIAEVKQGETVILKQELIRCKECKHRYNGKDDSPCELLNMPLGLSEDFYCMFAERK